MPVNRINVETVSYPYWWFPLIEIHAPNPNADAWATIQCMPYRVKDDQTNEFQYPVTIFDNLPPNCAAKLLEIPGMFAQSDFTSEASQAKQAALAVLLADADVPQLLAIVQQAIYTALAARVDIPEPEPLPEPTPEPPPENL